MHGKAQHVGSLQPSVGHVVAVTHPSDDFAVQTLQRMLRVAAVFDESEQVGQDLARVEFVG